MDRQLKLVVVVGMMTGLIALGAGSALAFVHCAAPTFPAVTTCSCGDTHTGSTAIQDAVDHAAPADTVCVGAGTYDEQVKIAKSLTLQGNAWDKTIIKPSTVSYNTTHLITDDPMAAIIVVDGAANVTVADMTIDGGPAGHASACGSGFVGIFYRGSSGSIERTYVTDIVHPSNLGCQSALGIFVQSNTALGLIAITSILDSGSVNYGKNGITANETGTIVDVERTVAAGLGDVAGVAAQNGIQIAFGARGRVKDNIIALNNSSSDDALSCGILFFQARGNTASAVDNIFGQNEYKNEQDICSTRVGSAQHLPSD